MIQETFIREVRVSYQATNQKPFSIRSPENIAAFTRNVLIDNSREHVFGFFLDGSHKVTCYALLTVGSANFAPLHPRELFQSK